MSWIPKHFSVKAERETGEWLLSSLTDIGADDRGWPIIQHEFACPPWLLEKLAAYGARNEDLQEEVE